MKAAAVIRDVVAEYAKKGFTKKKMSKLQEYEEEEGLYQDETDRVLGSVEMPGFEIGDITGLPEPTKAQWLEASKMFERSDGGASGMKTMKFQRDYLILKYAHLETKQLAELLETQATGNIKMPEEERWFVRGLFLIRVKGPDKIPKAGEDPGAPTITDKEMVQKWRDGKYGTTPDVKDKEEREAREKRQAQADAARGKGKGKKGKKPGKGKGGKGKTDGKGSGKTTGEGGGTGGGEGAGTGVGEDAEGGSETEGKGGGGDVDGKGGGADEDSFEAMEDDLFGGADKEGDGQGKGKGSKGKGKYDKGTDDKAAKTHKEGSGNSRVFPMAASMVGAMLTPDSKKMTVVVDETSDNYKNLVKWRQLSLDGKEEAWMNFTGQEFRITNFWFPPPVLVTALPPAVQAEQVAYKVYLGVELDVYDPEFDATEQVIEQEIFYAYPVSEIIQKELKVKADDLYRRTKEVKGQVQFDKGGVTDFGFFKGKVNDYKMVRESTETDQDGKATKDKYWILSMDVDVTDVPGKAKKINVTDAATGMLVPVTEGEPLKGFHIRTFTYATAQKYGVVD